MIDSNDSNANWVSPAPFELRNLIAQIADNAVDLLDHCLRQDFDFRANFDRRNLASANREAGFTNGTFPRDYFPKGAIAAPCVYSSSPISSIDHALASLNARHQFRRAADRNEVFIKVHGNEIALIGGTVFVRPALEQAAELRE